MKKKTSKPKVVIVLDGGLVQDILSTIAVDVAVVDYDVEGVDEDRLTEIPQGDDRPAEPAYCWYQRADRMPKRIREMFRAVGE